MIRELSYNESRKYLSTFQLEEKSYGTDWYDCEDLNATYIWLIENISEKPLGFLSYKKMILANKVDFVYIVKIYALRTHRGKNPILFNDKRVSEILFDEIYRKGIKIFTLESACKKLDIYYKNLGFTYNKEISNEVLKVIGTSAKVMRRIKNNIKLSDKEKNMFGDIR